MADLAEPAPAAAGTSNGNNHPDPVPALLNGEASAVVNGNHQDPSSDSLNVPAPAPVPAVRAPIIGDDAFLLYEEPANEDLPAPALPTEMLVKIMSKLDTPTLIRSTMLVSKRWNLVSKQVALRRVREIRDKSLWSTLDLRAYMSKSISQAAYDVQRQFVNEQGISAHFLQQLPNVKLLMFYYRTYFEEHNEIGLQWESLRGLLQGRDVTVAEKPFLRTLSRVTSASNDRQLVFMASHGLLILWVDLKFRFFAKPMVDAEDPAEWIEYRVSRQNITPPTFTGDISVHDNIILATGRTRKTVVYIRLERVVRANSRVGLNYLKEIFTPFFIKSSLYFNGKIFILYENCNFLGQWIESSDTLMLSEAALTLSGGSRVEWSFCRIANLVFLEPLLFVDVPWMCFDGSQDDLVFQNVNMPTLVKSIQPNLRDQAYDSVKKVYGFNNLFVAICVSSGAGNYGDTAVAPLMVSASVMRRTPKLEDFSSVEKFKSLFYLDKTRTHKLMGSLRSDLFYYLDGVNLLGEDDGGAFMLRMLKTFTSEP